MYHILGVLYVNKYVAIKEKGGRGRKGEGRKEGGKEWLKQQTIGSKLHKDQELIRAGHCPVSCVSVKLCIYNTMRFWEETIKPRTTI